MIDLNVEEAQLFRILTSLFGSDQVLFKMSVLSVCGGTLPAQRRGDKELESWAKRNRCLFTVLNHDDDPKLVVEFCSSGTKIIDVEQIEHKKVLPELLSANGIRYITLTEQDFSRMTDPEEPQGFCTVLKEKIDSLDAETDFSDSGVNNVAAK